MTPILKVYHAKFWNDDVLLMGNPEALQRLKTAIEQALETGSGRTELFESEGSKYPVVVRSVEMGIENFPAHYDDEDSELTQEEIDIIQKALQPDAN